jgi:hypothetical protein
MHPDHKLTPETGKKMGELLDLLNHLLLNGRATSEDKRLIDYLCTFHDDDERELHGYTISRHTTKQGGNLT